MITYEELISTNLGKPVEREDITNYAQCMDWAFAYCDALDIPRSAIRHLHAYEVWTLATDETRKYFDLIPNSATAVPQKGDLVIFGTGVGISGHICLADGNVDGTKTFQSTDENWNGHAYVEYLWHDYGAQSGDKRGVLGWLRPKKAITSSGPVAVGNTYKGYDLSNQESMKVAVDILVRVQAGEFIDKAKYDADIKSKQSTIDNNNQQISDRKNDIVTLNAKIGTLETQVLELIKKTESLQPQADLVPDLQKQNEHLTTQVATYQQAEKTWNRARAQLESDLAVAKKASLKNAALSIIDNLKNIWLKK